MKKQTWALLMLSQSPVPETDAVETAGIWISQKTEYRAGS